jgi:hypothetical protein
VRIFLGCGEAGGDWSGNFSHATTAGAKIFSEAATARHVQRDRENIFHFMGAVRAWDEALPSGQTSGLASAAELMLL